MPSTGAEPAAREALSGPDSIDEPYIHVVAAIIWSTTQPRNFLIAQRPSGKHLENFWEFPGGKLEDGEDPWQGLRRELEEEINIRATEGAPFMKVYYRYPERNVLLDTWSVHAWRGELLAREQQAIAWIDLDQIGEYRFPPADMPILEKLRERGG